MFRLIIQLIRTRKNWEGKFEKNWKLIEGWFEKIVERTKRSEKPNKWEKW